MSSGGLQSSLGREIVSSVLKAFGIGLALSEKVLALCFFWRMG